MAAASAQNTGKASLVEQVATLSLGARRRIVAGSALLAVTIFFIFFYMPYIKEKTGLKESISSAVKELSAQETALNQHQLLGQMKEAIDWSYEYMQQYLPQENEMPRLVQMVSEIGAQAGLSDGVTLFAPKLPAIVRPNYAEIPFSLKLQGEFTTVLSFLYDFSRINRIVNITEVTIGAPRMIDSQNEILHIIVDCSGSTYRSLTEEEEAAAQAGRPRDDG
jgi:type IV pilus assembly protein PilO